MKLTQRNYFSKKANLEYMSVSQFKAFQKCPACAIAEIKGKYKRDKSTALLVGSYIDSYFEGTLPQFKKANPEIYTKKGEVKADYLQAEFIIQRILKDKLFRNYMSGEKQVIMTGCIKDVLIKIKIDSLHPDKIVDLKIMGDFNSKYVEEAGRLPWFEAWGYDLQGAVYQEIVWQNTGKKLPFYLAAATKEKATDLDIVYLEQDLLDDALERFKKEVQFYDAMKNGVITPEGCGKCDYCRSKKILKVPTSSNEFYLY